MKFHIRTGPGVFIMSENKALVNNVVQEHLEKGIIEICTPFEDEYISNVFLRPKANGKLRLILDLSDLIESVALGFLRCRTLKQLLT